MRGEMLEATIKAKKAVEAVSFDTNYKESFKDIKKLEAVVADIIQSTHPILKALCLGKQPCKDKLIKVLGYYCGELEIPYRLFCDTAISYDGCNKVSFWGVKAPAVMRFLAQNNNYPYITRVLEVKYLIRNLEAVLSKQKRWNALDATRFAFVDSDSIFYKNLPEGVTMPNILLIPKAGSEDYGIRAKEIEAQKKKIGEIKKKTESPKEELEEAKEVLKALEEAHSMDTSRLIIGAKGKYLLKDKDEIITENHTFYVDFSKTKTEKTKPYVEYPFTTVYTKFLNNLNKHVYRSTIFDNIIDDDEKTEEEIDNKEAEINAAKGMKAKEILNKAEV